MLSVNIFTLPEISMNECTEKFLRWFLRLKKKKAFEAKQNFLTLLICWPYFLFVSFFELLHKYWVILKNSKKNVLCQIVFNLPLTASKKLKREKWKEEEDNQGWLWIWEKSQLCIEIHKNERWKITREEMNNHFAHCQCSTPHSSSCGQYFSFTLQIWVRDTCKHLSCCAFTKCSLPFFRMP